MTATFLLWLAMVTSGVVQTALPLSLHIRVFRGQAEVTRETTVTVYPAGARTNGQPAPVADGGERRLPLAAGQYDLQLVQQQDGKVSGIVWTTLRLLVDYPGEGGHHLEVLNFEKEWGALEVRAQGPHQSGQVGWRTRLLRKDGTEVARGVDGEGYQLVVAPAGTYDLVVEGGAAPVRIADVDVKANLTYVRTF
ncbi:hypothetical protein LuPra_02882 [Luteitalea pratensis]|uniref:Uncharacterized protein n=1 Tax=Luteitalea pratensis TaxID=1855912 RepID=A0A143PND7_LUTPR|nr:hypothetical protein [Luteitalea pratensis]AMY09660.1 hypothetical protein LuPra_02882 [Luteitalea pratensis]